MQERYTIAYEGAFSEADLNALYGIASLRAKKPKNNTIFSYSYTNARLKRSTILFAILFLLIDLILFIMKSQKLAPTLHPLYSCMVVLCLFFCICYAFLWWSVRKTYKDFRSRYSASLAKGLLTIDALGICDETADGEISRHPWKQLDCCIITPRAIVIRFKTGSIIYLPATHETAQMIGTALTAYGYSNTIHICTIKEP